MPHLQHASIDTNDTFDLEKPDRSDSAQPDYELNETDHATRHSRISSGMYGVAVTSEHTLIDNEMHSNDTEEERRGEVKQQLRRRSMPVGTPADAYAYAADHSADIEALIPPARNESLDAQNYSYNTNASRRSGQIYDGQFQYKDHEVTPAKQRAQRKSPVIAELKTNVIIKDEFTLVTDLSYQLAQRYARLESSVMVKVDHTACVALGGTFDPCYLLTIHSVPSHMGPATNKRNASLIQSFMAEILSVPPERGIVTFVPIPEENVAIGGNTLRGEIEKAERLDAAASRKEGVEAARRSAAAKRSMPNLQARANGYTLVNGIHESNSSSDAERPRTSYGPNSPGAVNGLRMNPINPDELRASSPRPSNNTRPRSILASDRSSLSNQISNGAKQTTTTQSRQPKTEPKARSILIDARKKPTATQQLLSTHLAPRPVQAPAATYNASAVTPFSLASTTSTKVSGPPALAVLSEARNKAVYLDMVTALPATNKSSTITVRSEELGLLSSDESAAAAPTIHTKRRSATFSNAPKLPPQPPSPTFMEKEETKSMSSRLSKRKSLMKLFKRESSVPAWYKQ